jgi:hypothetical protein
MEATLVLTDVALLLVVWLLWEDWRQRDALDSTRRTRLLVAGIFSVVGVVTTLLG